MFPYFSGQNSRVSQCALMSRSALAVGGAMVP